MHPGRNFRGYLLFAAVFAAPAAIAAPDALILGDGHDGVQVFSDVDVSLLPFYGNVATNVSAGATTVEFFGPTVDVGDIVLIIQMTGAMATSADPSAVDVSSSGAGQYEFRKVVTTNGSSYSFTDALENSYTMAGSQIFVVPQYLSLTLINSTMSMKTWDGFSGGVGVVFVQGAITLSSVSWFLGEGAGYRGGQVIANNSDFECTLDLKTPANGGGPPKGEGITGIYGTDDLDSAYGNYANGGGGGNCFGAGGGGGSNAGEGGSGGRQWNVTAPPDYGGFGGSWMVVPDHATHGLMGGGGGTGHRNNSGDSSGANGGGIWFIRASTFSSDSGGISVAGADALYAGTDGAGGGGAGGTIIAHIHGEMNCASGPAFIASGGDGGSVVDPYGPGGGGGGGTLRVRYLFGSCPVAVPPGNHGLADETFARSAGNGVIGLSDVCVDSDLDGSCDGADLCTGLDYTGDTDNDGLCDDIDDPDLIFSNGFE